MNDLEFLQWVHNRLNTMYGENESVDFMTRLQCIINATDPNKTTPNTSDLKKGVTVITRTSNVAPMFDYIATCPDCEGDLWRMLTEAPPEDKSGTAKIIATECDNCKLRLNWV